MDCIRCSSEAVTERLAPFLTASTDPRPFILALHGVEKIIVAFTDLGEFQTYIPAAASEPRRRGDMAACGVCFVAAQAAARRSIACPV